MRKGIGRWVGGGAGLLLVFALWGGIQAQEKPGLQELVKKLQERYEGVTAMEAEFSQVSQMAKVQKSFQGKGKVFFQKPGKMRWEYGPPDKQVVISDGEKIWFYQPKEKQVVLSRLARAFSGKAPVNFLMGIGRINEDFQLSLLAEKGEKEGNYFEIEMTPKEELADVKKIVLRVNQEDFLVSTIRVYDFFLNLNEISLKKIKTNKELSPKLFSFTPPKGVRVIEPPPLPAPAAQGK